MSMAKKSSVAARPATSKAAGRMVPAAVSRKLKVPAKGVAKASANTFLPLKLAYTFDIDPLVDAVQRHVHLKPRIADELREEFRRMFEESVRHMTGPKRLRVKPASDPVLTTQEAADLAGVSRPFMVARIDAGDIPLHQQVGNQRRVLRSSVLKWKEQERGKRRDALKRLGQALEDEISW